MSRKQPKYEYVFALELETEFSSETFNTAKDAIRAAEFDARQEGLEDKQLRVGRVQMMDPPESMLDAHHWIETWITDVQDQISKFTGDECGFEQFMPPNGNVEELEKTIRTACSQWLDDHYLRPHPFRVVETREYIIKNGKARKPEQCQPQHGSR